MRNIHQINSFQEINLLEPLTAFTFPPGAINYYGIKFISHGIRSFHCIDQFYLYLGNKKHLVAEIAKSNIKNIIITTDFDKKFIDILEQYNKNSFYVDNINIIHSDKL